MSLQQLVFCDYIDRVLDRKTTIWTEYDTFLIRAYDKLVTVTILENDNEFNKITEKIFGYS